MHKYSSKSALESTNQAPGYGIPCPSKRLYLFNPASCPKELTGLIGGKVREPVISSNGIAKLIGA
jgi:hypothetical protein